MTREQALENAREFCRAHVAAEYKAEAIPEFAAALLDAQADALAPYCECLLFEAVACPACSEIIRLRAEASALRKEKP